MDRESVLKEFRQVLSKALGKDVKKLCESRRAKYEFVDSGGSDVIIQVNEVFPVTSKIEANCHLIFDVLVTEDGKTVYPDTYTIHMKKGKSFAVSEDMYEVFHNEIDSLLRQFA